MKGCLALLLLLQCAYVVVNGDEAGIRQIVLESNDGSVQQIESQLTRLQAQIQLPLSTQSITNLIQFFQTDRVGSSFRTVSAQIDSLRAVLSIVDAIYLSNQTLPLVTSALVRNLLQDVGRARTRASQPLGNGASASLRMTSQFSNTTYAVETMSLDDPFDVTLETSNITGNVSVYTNEIATYLRTQLPPTETHFTVAVAVFDQYDPWQSTQEKHVNRTSRIFSINVLSAQTLLPVQLPASLPITIDLTASEGLARPARVQSLCMTRTPLWEEDNCQSEPLSSTTMRCTCTGGLDFATYLTNLTFRSTTPQTQNTDANSVPREDQESSEWLSSDLIFLILAIVVLTLVVLIVWALLRWRMVGTPKADDSEAALADNAPPVTQQEADDLYEQFSDVEDERQFEFGAASDVESDDEKRDFSVGLEEEDDAGESQQRRQTGVYDENAATLPPQIVINKTPTTRSVSQVMRQPRTPQRASVQSSLQPASTRITATTPQSTASLVRSLSSARKLTQ